jgi:hypothetical protein
MSSLASQYQPKLYRQQEMEKTEPEKTTTVDVQPVEFQPKISELDKAVERALFETSNALANVMGEFGWDSDRIYQQSPVRWSFVMQRAGQTAYALARAYEMFIGSRLKEMDDQIKRRRLRELAKAKVALMESYESVSQSKRV